MCCLAHNGMWKYYCVVKRRKGLSRKTVSLLPLSTAETAWIPFKGETLHGFKLGWNKSDLGPSVTTLATPSGAYGGHLSSPPNS